MDPDDPYQFMTDSEEEGGYGEDSDEDLPLPFKSGVCSLQTCETGSKWVVLYDSNGDPWVNIIKVGIHVHEPFVKVFPLQCAVTS